MNNDCFESRMNEICEKLGNLPAEQQAQLKALVEETRQRHEDTQRNIKGAMEALDDWRLAMKYRLFDMEATIREQRDKNTEE